MRLLNIGPERKLAAAQAVLRRFTIEMIMERRKNGHVITGKAGRTGRAFLGSARIGLGPWKWWTESSP
jgi:hypothetical protein